MTLTLTSEQLSLLQYANDARDFDGYIYNTERNTPPSGWVQDTRFIINDSSTGLYAEVWTKGNTTMFVIRGTEMGDSGDLSNDLQMLEGKVGQQNLKFCQWFQQNQGQFEGQRVIFTGNSAAATNAESAAAIFGKEAIGTNGYGYQPNINDLANALGVSVSTNPSDYANRIINFITQSDLVGNAGTHLGLNLYVPEPNDIWQSLKNLPPSPLSAFINAYYYAYDGHLPYNFNDYDLTNPSADSRITDEPSSTAKFFNNFGESLRTLLSGLDDVAISAATIAVTGTALNPIIKLGLGLITYTFNSDNSLSIAPSTLNGLSRRELAQIASSLLFSSTNNNFNRINVENGINDYFITKDMHGTLLYESATVNGQLLTPEVYEIMQGALTGGAANLNYKMNFFGLSSFDPLRGFFNIANSVINGLGSLFDHIMNFFNPIGAFYEGGTLCWKV